MTGRCFLETRSPDGAAVMSGPAFGNAPGRTETPDIDAVQAEANRTAGPRSVPSRVVPVPSNLDAADAALVAAPYAPSWNLAPPDEAAWREIQRGAADGMVPRLAEIRARFEVSIAPTCVGGVKAYFLAPRRVPEAHRNRLVFFLHGGGYVLGQGESGTAEAALMAAYGGYRVLSIDYRLAPGAPYPAALDDALAAWRAVVGTADPRHIAVGGMSAGGALALALMLRIKAEGLPLPAAIATGSPWSDMTRTGDSYRTNEWLDNVLVRYDGYLSRAARLYANGHDLREPGLSPIYGDFQGLPPAILSTGTRDLFLSNTVRTHRKLREAGTDAELHVYEGMSHAQYALNPDAPVTKAAYGEVAHFFDRYLAR